MAGSIRFRFLIATTCLFQIVLVAKEKVMFVDFERINVTYYNPKYLRNINVTCRRFGRKDPIHYVHLHGENLVPVGNEIMLDYYVYEFLSNEYRRSFVELHFKLCDLLFHDQLFGPLLNMGLPKACPIPPGMYHMENISLVGLPLLRTFPFQKGRIYVYAKAAGAGEVRERVVDVYVDAAIKEKWR